MNIWQRKKVFFPGLLFIGLAIAAYAFHFRTRWAVDDYKQRLQAAGEKLTIEEIRQSGYILRRNRNNLLLEAASLLKTNYSILELAAGEAMVLTVPGRAMRVSAQPEVEANGRIVSWEEIGNAVADDQAAFERLRNLIDNPVLDFESDPRWSRPDYLTPLLRFTFRLLPRAIYELHRGDTASAITDIRCLVAMVKGLEHDEFAVAQFFRLAINWHAFAGTWEILQSPGLTDGPLAGLQHDWMNLEFLQAAERALVAERACGLQRTADWRNSSAELESFLMPADLHFSTWRRARIKARILEWQLSGSYADELCALEVQQVVLDAFRRARANQCFDPALRLQKARLQTTRLAKLGWHDLGEESRAIRICFSLEWNLSGDAAGMSSLLLRVWNAELERQMAVTAIALKRYEIRHGYYPPGLADLVPELLPSVPRDPMDGQPLRYEQTAGGFRLYSVGKDGVDDGGNSEFNGSSARPHWLDGRDAVWLSPAGDL